MPKDKVRLNIADCATQKSCLCETILRRLGSAVCSSADIKAEFLIPLILRSSHI